MKMTKYVLKMLFTEIFAPRDGYERLVMALIEYDSSTPSPNEGMKLVEYIRNGCFPIPLTDKDKAKVRDALNVLESTENLVIRGCFGIGGGEMTSKQIGEMLSVKPPMVGKIRKRALQKLRHHPSLELVSYFKALTYREKIERLQKDRDSLENCLIAAEEIWQQFHDDVDRKLRDAANDVSASLQGQMTYDMLMLIERRRKRITEKSKIIQILHTPVDDLDLSVRSANCLRSACITEIGELTRRTESEMLKYRNVGRVVLHELAQILEGLGLRWGMNVKDYGYDK